MNTPDSREEFERNIHLLVEYKENGRFRMPHGSGTETGLSEMRRLPNGRFDLLSINEMARLTANMMVNGPDSEFQED